MHWDGPTHSRHLRSCTEGVMLGSARAISSAQGLSGPRTVAGHAGSGLSDKPSGLDTALCVITSPAAGPLLTVQAEHCSSRRPMAKPKRCSKHSEPGG